MKIIILKERKIIKWRPARARYSWVMELNGTAAACRSWWNITMSLSCVYESEKKNFNDCLIKLPPFLLSRPYHTHAKAKKKVPVAPSSFYIASSAALHTTQGGKSWWCWCDFFTLPSSLCAAAALIVVRVVIIARFYVVFFFLLLGLIFSTFRFVFFGINIHKFRCLKLQRRQTNDDLLLALCKQQRALMLRESCH